MNIQTKLPLLHKTFIGTALVSTAFTAASIFKVPGKSMLAETNGTSLLYKTGRMVFDNFIDPVTENPIIPTTIAGLALMGVLLTEPKEKDENK